MLNSEIEMLPDGIHYKAGRSVGMTHAHVMRFLPMLLNRNHWPDSDTAPSATAETGHNGPEDGPKPPCPG